MSDRNKQRTTAAKKVIQSKPEQSKPSKSSKQELPKQKAKNQPKEEEDYSSDDTFEVKKAQNQNSSERKIDDADMIESWIKTVNDIQKETITTDDLKNLNKSFQSNVVPLKIDKADKVREFLLLLHLTFLKVLFDKMCEYGRYVIQPIQKQILELDNFKKLFPGSVNSKEIKNGTTKIETAFKKERKIRYQEYEQFYQLYKEFTELVKTGDITRNFDFFQEDVSSKELQNELIFDASLSLMTLFQFSQNKPTSDE
jgi:hypothetical protein